MSTPLHPDVFVVPYKPIAGLIPPMGEVAIDDADDNVVEPLVVSIDVSEIAFT